MVNKRELTRKTGRKPNVTSQKTEKSKKQPSWKELPNRLVKKFNGLYPGFKLAIALVLVLVLVGFSMIAFTGSGTEELANEEPQEVAEIETADAIGASVTYTEGTLQVLNEENVWVDAEDDLQPTEGTKLRTVGATSRAVITFDEGSALRIDANSEVELERVVANRIEIHHIAGYTYNRVTPSESRTYIVFSEDAQYEALGTAFKTATTGDEQSVEVYHSSVKETNTNLTPTEGEKLIVKSEVSPGDDGTIKDIDIELLKQDPFITWNKNLDEQDENFKDLLGYLSDFDAPEIIINSAADGDIVLLDSSANEGTTTFSGSTERGATLTVESKSQSGAAPVEVGVDGSGNFTTPLLSAPIGDAVFTFEVKDRVGNIATKNIRITFQRKSAPVASVNAIVLNGSLNDDDDKVELSWTLSGELIAPDGVKVLFDDNSGLSYPQDSETLVNSGNSYSIKTSKLDKGETNYFRVCVYDADKDECTKYSNELSIAIP